MSRPRYWLFINDNEDRALGLDAIEKPKPKLTTIMHGLDQL